MYFKQMYLNKNIKTNCFFPLFVITLTRDGVLRVKKNKILAQGRRFAESRFAKNT